MDKRTTLQCQVLAVAITLNDHGQKVTNGTITRVLFPAAGEKTWTPAMARVRSAVQALKRNNRWPFPSN
jgi:hypothetical protein